MKKFVYSVVPLNGHSLEKIYTELSKAGQFGWELVTIYSDWAYFKKEEVVNDLSISVHNTHHVFPANNQSSNS